MDIVLHVGAHFTEEERLMKCLLRNKEGFAKRGIAVPGPGKYRRLLNQTFAALQKAPPSADARDVLLDAFLDDQSADRVILSHANIFGAPRACLRDGQFYIMAADRVSTLAQLFPQCLTIKPGATTYRCSRRSQAKKLVYLLLSIEHRLPQEELLDIVATLRKLAGK